MPIKDGEYGGTFKVVTLQLKCPWCGALQFDNMLYQIGVESKCGRCGQFLVLKCEKVDDINDALADNS